MITKTPQSSWIDSIAYRPTPVLGPGRGYVAFFLRPVQRSNGVTDERAILYGPELPSWIVGLVTAGCGGVSVGRAYHALVKGKYQSQTITDEAKIKELKQLMKGQNNAS